jgi:phage-related protein
MITYYKKDDNNAIIATTTDKRWAEKLGYNEFTEESIIEINTHNDSPNIKMLYSDFLKFSETAQYKNMLREKSNEKIQAQIEELDGKRSRAFFEPSEKEAGLTWLDYYNQEIIKLRALLK